MNPLMMYCIKDNTKEKQLALLCRQLGIHTRRLKETDLNMALGTLAGIKMDAGVMSAKKKTQKGTVLPNHNAITRQVIQKKAPKGTTLPEILVFSGFSDEKLDIFLKEYKKAGITPVGLKAVLTQHNVFWSLYELVGELQREQIAMMMGRKQ